jgi:sterol O-acyltransferase
LKFLKIKEKVLLFSFFLFRKVISMLILPQRTQNNAFNVFIWTSLFVGLGMQMCLYSIEWYARQNCPRAVVSINQI